MQAYCETTLHLQLGALEVQVECEYEPSEREQPDCPGWPAQGHVYAVKVGGVDIIEYLSESAVESLSEQVIRAFGG